MVPIVSSSILLLHESNGRSRSMCLCVCLCTAAVEPLYFLAHPFTITSACRTQEDVMLCCKLFYNF